MKTKNNYKVGITTLGCSKNQVDSEFLAGELKAYGVDTSHDIVEGETDAVIINTCGFINDAKEESINTILDFLQAKKEGRISQVFAMGCLTERYRDELTEEFDDIDGVFGVNEMDKIVNTISGRLKTELIGERLLTTPSHYAFLKISEGCDRSCSFCAIPLIRGKNISLPIETLVEEAKALAANGVKELILIAQDLTYYGLDLYHERKLGALIKELEKIDGIEWIRLHYTFPSQFPLDVLEAMANSEKICNYIDIPLQHINSRILKSMRRGIDREGTEKLVEKFRTLVPYSAIRTTMIVGYPGETEEEFEELVEFVKAVRFDRLGVFTYSEEENTPAFELEDDVPEEVKNSRMELLMDVQQEISLELNSDKVGKEFKVIIDRVEGDYFVGRTEFDSPDVDNEVLIENSNDLKIGDFVKVKIFKADFFDLFGEICR
ncbi:MAG: 30S ribosomal protein S12 methylthiotransferase RimO [Bacteroidota bacterium]|nr:30S ribosomal protein S12 methylthiotransferase RimO [Bacteroidota bacterium]